MIEAQLGPGDELIVIHNQHGDFGNHARDQGCAQATGDLLMFCDDDDVYTPDALATVRRETAGQLDRVHLFRMNSPRDGVVWADETVRLCNVGTPMFVIPNNKRRLGRWVNSEVAFSDYRFLTDTLALHDQEPVFHREVIAHVRPHHQ